MIAKNDTICAISTAYGEGAIGIVRVSGPEAEAVFRRVFVPKGAERDIRSSGRILRYGSAVGADGTVLDEVLAVFMKGPKTYTGEDLCEIQCHGGVLVTRKILEACHEAGARYAEAGEFTKRAFLCGRLDLAEAESVIELIEAGSGRAYEEALRKLKGSLSREVREIREALTDELVLLAVNIDYPDEDIELATLETLMNALHPIRERVRSLSASSETGKVYREGLSCAIAGTPNVGKSSLLNAFLREERAIVTDVPGTTRDTIQESILVDGIRIMFTDTAGVRETDDPIEKIGVERSRDAVLLSDVALFLLDATRPLTAEDISLAELFDPKKTIFVLNKADGAARLKEEDVRSAFPRFFTKGDETIYRISAKTGENVAFLRKVLADSVLSGLFTPSDGLVITSLRQKESIERALSSLNDALSAAERGEALDIIETDVRSAWESLGEIVGETASEDIVDRVFERFCLGK